jgi:hypothetical protein
MPPPGGWNLAAYVLRSSSKDCPGACCWNTPTYGGDTARTLVDLLVTEEKIAKSADSGLRTFGDIGVVCLGASGSQGPILVFVV